MLTVKEMFSEEEWAKMERDGNKLGWILFGIAVALIVLVISLPYIIK